MPDPALPVAQQLSEAIEIHDWVVERAQVQRKAYGLVHEELHQRDEFLRDLEDIRPQFAPGEYERVNRLFVPAHTECAAAMHRYREQWCGLVEEVKEIKVLVSEMGCNLGFFYLLIGRIDSEAEETSGYEGQ